MTVFEGLLFQNTRRATALAFLAAVVVVCVWCTAIFFEQDAKDSKYRFTHKTWRNFRNYNRTATDNDTDFIVYTVKTSKQFDNNRLDILLKTWIRKLTAKVFFISDGEDPKYDEKTGHRLVATGCGTLHNIRDLCCKLDAEFTTMTKQKNPKWWCHFDDDMYVNVRVLEKELRKYDWRKPWYIGRKSVPGFEVTLDGKSYPYQFAHGGCGFCLSSTLWEKMTPWIGDGKFEKSCGDFGVNDDCSIGVIVTHYLKVSLTESFLFHSHSEQLENVPEETINEQISLSYRDDGNLIKLSNARFNDKEDPTRLLSLHCHIYPVDEMCL